MAAALRQFSNHLRDEYNSGPLGFLMTGPTLIRAERQASRCLRTGISCDGLTSKRLREANLRAADLVVNMTGVAATELFEDRTLPIEDWDVFDPFGCGLDVYRGEGRHRAARNGAWPRRSRIINADTNRLIETSYTQPRRHGRHSGTPLLADRRYS
jgi:hypothetical protein